MVAEVGGYFPFMVHMLVTAEAFIIFVCFTAYVYYLFNLQKRKNNKVNF